MKRNQKEVQIPEHVDCQHCLFYVWFGDEEGYQCLYKGAPPCQDAMLATDE